MHKGGLAITNTGVDHRKSHFTIGETTSARAQKGLPPGKDWVTSNQAQFSYEGKRVAPIKADAFAGRPTGIAKG